MRVKHGDLLAHRLTTRLKKTETVRSAAGGGGRSYNKKKEVRATSSARGKKKGKKSINFTDERERRPGAKSASDTRKGTGNRERVNSR